MICYANISTGHGVFTSYDLGLHWLPLVTTGDSLAAAQQGKWSKHASYESFSESSNHRSSSCSTSVFTSRNLSVCSWSLSKLVWSFYARTVCNELLVLY